jgi:hypothetical protein
MQSPIFLVSWAAGLCALWFLWSLGIKRLLLDGFRERLFELRFELFRLGCDGSLPFDSDTYRSLETLINGLLRFAHRVFFMSYVLSRIEQEQAKKDKDYVDVSKQLALKISRLDPTARSKVIGILNSIRSAIVLYMTFSSLFLFALIMVLLFLKRLGLWRPDNAKAELSGVIEREAYRFGDRHPLKVVHA